MTINSNPNSFPRPPFVQRPPNFPLRVSNPADLPSWYPWWTNPSVAGKGWPEHMESIEECDKAINDLKKAMADHAAKQKAKI